MNHLLLQCSRGFSQHAWLSLLTILLLLGAFLGLWYAHPSTQTTDSTRSGGGQALCSHASLGLQPSASVAELTGMLKAEDARIIYGPDEFGEYQLRFAQTPSASALARLQARAGVAHVIEHRTCP